MNFLKKISSTFYLIISIILLIYTFYKSEIVWNGEKSDYYLTYYIISFTLILFSIITFFFNKKIREYLVIILLSFVISIYSFEIYFTFKDQFKKNQIYKTNTGKKFDNRSRLEIYTDLLKNNQKLAVVVSPLNYINKKNQIFPLSGISNTKTIYCNENGYFSIYLSDRFGFNNPDNEWDQDEIEYLLIGDSYTHGACVNRPHDIGSVLRKLSKKSVLNLGYAGNGPLIQYATLKEYLSPNNKKVIWIYYEGNDLANLKKELTDKTLKNYLRNKDFKQNLRFKQNEIDTLSFQEIQTAIIKQNKNSLKVKKFINENLKKFIKINNTRTILNKFLPKKNQPERFPLPQQEFKEILKLTKDLVDENNSKLYFVYLPESSIKINSESNSSYLSIKKILEELDIPLIDIKEEVFNKHANPMKFFPFELQGHYNVIGYQEITKKIYQLTND